MERTYQICCEEMQDKNQFYEVHCWNFLGFAEMAEAHLKKFERVQWRDL
jgi:hypothetical protein